MEPIMEAQPAMDAQKPDKEPPAKPEEYIEKRKFFYCWPLKAGVILFGVVLMIDLLLEAVNLVIIFNNESFIMAYPLVYFVCLLPLVTAVIIYSYYYVSEDSIKTRKWLPWAHLLGALTSLLLILWIIIYIGCIYDREMVYVNRWDREVNPSPEDMVDERTHKGKYIKESKQFYILWHIIPPIVFGIAYLVFYFTTDSWVQRHSKQQRTYG